MRVSINRKREEACVVGVSTVEINIVADGFERCWPTACKHGYKLLGHRSESCTMGFSDLAQIRHLVGTVIV